MQAVLVCALVVGVGAVVLWRLLGSRRSRTPPKPCPLKGPASLDPETKIPFTLIKKEEISHDVRLFRFALQTPQHVLGAEPGNHIYLSAKINGSRVIRPYSPITSNDEQGYFDIMLKVYFANVHPKFPAGGKMTQYLNSLEVGAVVDVRGPAGRAVYLGQGCLRIKEHGRPHQIRWAKELGLIAGGTGITPLLAVVRAVLKDSEDSTKISLIFANKTEADILLRAELEELAEKHDCLSVWYTVSSPTSADWSYSVGHVCADMIAQHLPPPGPSCQLLLCGPPPMIKLACLPALTTLRYTEDMWTVF